MKIEDALSQVRAIQTQVARTEQFCCYRWATVAASGMIAIGVALTQASWVTEPVQQPLRYLQLWVAVAAASATIISSEMLARWLQSDSQYARRQTLLAVRQFTPCLLVGALLTFSIQWYCPEHAVLYPAIWSTIFSLGIFASSQHLPAGGLGLAGYYLAAGLVCLRWGQVEQALAPWTMVITFGVGQLITARLLFRQAERLDDQT